MIMSSSSILLLFLIVLIPCTQTVSVPIVTRLIHCDSVHSPLYDPTETEIDRFNRLANVSAASLLQRYNSSESDDGCCFPSELIRSRMERVLFVEFEMGSSFAKLYTFMDTGSSLFRVRCSSDKKYPYYFDSTKSDSVRWLPCDHQFCRSLPFSQCPDGRSCRYTQRYANDTESTGRIATDDIFLSDDEFEYSIKDVPFRCSEITSGGPEKEERYSGIFGLGPGPALPVKNTVFTYCLGDLSHHKDYDSHYLVLMDDVERVAKRDDIFIQKAYLTSDGGHYILNLVGMITSTVDILNKKLTVFIDSGAMVSYFPDWIFDWLVEQVDKAVQRYIPGGAHKANSKGRLCYEEEIKKFESVFLGLELLFQGATHDGDSATMYLDYNSLFYVRPKGGGLVCMSIEPMSNANVVIDENVAILGLLAQQHHQLTFDLSNQVLYLFWSPGCSDMGRP